MEPICWGPRKVRGSGAFRTVDADSDTGDLLPLIVALLDLRGGRDRRRLLALLESSSRPGVAGVAYLPLLAGGASPSPCGEGRSSSRPGVAGVAYLPLLAGGASPSPCGKGRSSSRPGVADVAYRLRVTGGASLSPLGAGARGPCAGEVGARRFLLDLDDMVSGREVS